MGTAQLWFFASARMWKIFASLTWIEYDEMEVSEVMGLPPNHQFLERMFLYKPSSYWGIPILRNPQISSDLIGILKDV